MDKIGRLRALADWCNDRQVHWAAQKGDYAQGRVNAFCEAEYEIRQSIAELGQEVGAVADGAALLVRDVCEMAPADPDASDTVCIRVSDLTRIAELYTSPAHTSEARDAELLTYKEIVRRLASTREGCLALAKVVHRELDFIDKCITDAIARCESDAAMRQEGGTP